MYLVWTYLKSTWEYLRVAEILPCDPWRCTGEEDHVHVDGGPILGHNLNLVVETLHNLNVKFSLAAIFRFYQMRKTLAGPQRKTGPSHRSGHLRKSKVRIKKSQDYHIIKFVTS